MDNALNMYGINYLVKTLDGAIVAAGKVEKGTICVGEIVPKLVVGTYSGASLDEEGYASHPKTAFGVEHKFIHRRIGIRKSFDSDETSFYIRASAGKEKKQGKLRVTVSHD